MEFFFRKLKIIYRICISIFGFVYHCKRFIFSSGITLDYSDKLIRSYDSIRIAHALEKSMSFSNRKVNSGWFDAIKLKDLLKESDPKKLDDAEIISILTLKKFLNFKENKANQNRLLFYDFLTKFKKINKKKLKAGVEVKNKNFFRRGVLKNNEQFFNSRYSIRDFKKSKVNINLIDKAVKLASKTPSVCNRQSWHVYHSSNKKVISKVLSFQSGNRGFAKLIPNLVIITTDLKSFLTGKEIYQQWIDGGLFSMSFIYAMHSIGVATCPLNWSQDPITDKNIRKNINIKTNQTIIMMIAIGHYKDNTTVCMSSRLKNRKLWSEIKLKKNI